MFGWLKSASHLDETDVVAYDASNANLDDDDDEEGQQIPQATPPPQPEEVEKFQTTTISCKDGFPFVLGSRTFMLLPTKSSRNAYTKQQAIIRLYSLQNK